MESQHLFFRLRLIWRLLHDPRVPGPIKLIIPAGVLYALWPLDLIPAFIPVLGQLDDLLVLIIAASIFFRLCSQALIREHTATLLGKRPDNSKPQDSDSDANTIEGRYRI
ncbi:MAG: DUF1232 domain-containing protein, partial [Chloroflexi bacterium]|nr:DUF1232 domain-containing protein [Chloroflexota bacterium]